MGVIGLVVGGHEGGIVPFWCGRGSQGKQSNYFESIHRLGRSKWLAWGVKSASRTRTVSLKTNNPEEITKRAS
jgi:hypothetical protein